MAKIWVVIGLVLLLSTACSESSSEYDSTGSFAPTPSGEDQVLVSAATSLTAVFAELSSEFESANPGIDVVLNFAGSTALREQILEGAPIDVFASADRSNMQRAVESGEVEGRPEIFARNVLQIAVSAGNPADVTGLDDFARSELLIGLCISTVPCGELAREALAKEGVTPSIDSVEPNVRALLTKVEAGELDAGITYLTDVLFASDAIEGIDLPSGQNVIAEYPIAVLTNARSPAAAAMFMKFVLSGEAQSILHEYGFISP